jgi:hypothetical protein
MAHGNPASVNCAQGSERRWCHGQGDGATFPCATVQHSIRCFILRARCTTGNLPKGVFSDRSDQGMVCSGDHIPLRFDVGGSAVLLSSGNGTRSDGGDALSSCLASGQEPLGWLVEVR